MLSPLTIGLPRGTVFTWGRPGSAAALSYPWAARRSQAWVPAVFFMRQNTAGSPLRPFRPRRPPLGAPGKRGVTARCGGTWAAVETARKPHPCQPHPCIAKRPGRAESNAPKRHKISFILLRSLIREYAAKGRRNKIDIIVIVQRRPG